MAGRGREGETAETGRCGKEVWKRKREKEREEMDRNGETPTRTD